MANEAKQFTINGVTHDVMDVGARQLIADLQTAINAITSGDTTTAIKTFQEVIDFLDGVTDDATLIGILDKLRTLINAKYTKPNTGIPASDLADGVIPDAYTKTETDEAIADAVEGLGGGSVESVTINGQVKTPDSQGNVDLGTVVGQQGPKGDTVVVSTEGLEQFGLANELDSSSTTDGLTARQGKILKQNVEALWAKVNALINDLAAMAFTGTKTSGLGTIDWTGGTFYATIVKSLTGCTATDNTTNGQIAEGSTLTMQLTASSGYTLTGATISVTDSRGQSVAYTLANNTITIAGTNVVGTITISVVAKAVYSVANNDTHVDMTTQTPNPVAGSSWSGTLSLKSGVTGYTLASNPSVKMNNVVVDFTASGNSWNRSTGAMTIGNVTGDIVILEAAVEVVAHTVTKKLLNMTSSNTTGDTTDADFGYKMQSVQDGDSYNTTLAPVSGATSNNDVVVKMGGVDITSTVYNSGTGVVNIASVTGDVTIIATASTGVVKVTANAAVTGGITISGTTISGTTISNKSIDLINGELTLEDAMKSFTKFTLTSDAKAAITAVDFGGATSTARLGLQFGNTSTSTSCNVLTSLKGLVLNASDFGDSVANCTALTEIDTIGWTCAVLYIANAFKNTALTALDIEDLNVTANYVNNLLIGSNSLAVVKLPSLPNVTKMDYLATNTGVSGISISGGSGVTTMRGAFSGCSSLSYIDLSGLTITSSLTTIATLLNGAGSNITLKVGAFDLSGVSDSDVHKMDKIKTLICTTDTPPNSALFTYMTALTAIYVPDAVVDNYKAASGWSTYASIIYSINDYTE